MNKVLVLGRVTRDVEVVTHQTKSGEFKVINNSIALNRRYKNAAGEMIDEVTFADFVITGPRADIFAKWVKKGHSVQLEGRLYQNSYETKDGQKRSRLEIRVENFELLNNNPSPAAQDAKEPAKKPAAAKPAAKPAAKKEQFESTYEDAYAGETIPF